MNKRESLKKLSLLSICGEIIVRAGLKYISRAVGVLDDLEFVYGLRRSREIVAFARKPVDASLDVDGLDMQRVVLVGVQRIGLW